MNKREVVVIGGSRIGRRVLAALQSAGVAVTRAPTVGGLSRQAEKTARREQERAQWNAAVDAKKRAKKGGPR